MQISASHKNAPALAVIGAGAIGLSVAFEALARDWRVDVVDGADAPAGNASRAAAGMLAPFSEAIQGDGDDHPDLLALGVESLALWPAWAQAVADASGAAFAPVWRGSRVFLSDLEAGRAKATALGARARVDGPALMIADEGHVNPRDMTAALAGAVRARGGVLHYGAACTRIDPGLRPEIVLANGARRAADAVVIAGGVAAAGLSDQFPVLGAIAPVKGQMARLTILGRPGQTPVLRGPGVYVAPRGDDRAVVGATVERGVTDLVVDDDVIAGLIQRAVVLDPGLAAGVIVETWAGLRPDTPDHAPLLGAIGDGVFAAAGHYRNGVLLTPATGRAVMDLVEDRANPLARRFDPYRAFAPAG